MRHCWLLLLGWLLGCGGADKGTGGEPGPGPPEPQELRSGRVLVDNQTLYVVEVSYLNEVRAEAPRIVRTQVGSGLLQDVSKEVLPGGIEVEFDLVILLPREKGYRVRRKARVTVDGEVIVRVSLEDAGDPFSVRIQVLITDTEAAAL